ncbi:MAG: HNH endonuclease [Candidatus Cybelea sp.]
MRLVRAGLLGSTCHSCGLKDWHGRPLSLHLDHINGVRNDNRLENLRMLCPNCHSQTPTYGGRNTRLRRLQEPAGVV